MSYSLKPLSTPSLAKEATGLLTGASTRSSGLALPSIVEQTGSNAVNAGQVTLPAADVLHQPVSGVNLQRTRPVVGAVDTLQDVSTAQLPLLVAAAHACPPLCLQHGEVQYSDPSMAPGTRAAHTCHSGTIDLSTKFDSGAQYALCDYAHSPTTERILRAQWVNPVTGAALPIARSGENTAVVDRVMQSVTTVSLTVAGGHLADANQAGSALMVHQTKFGAVFREKR